MDIRLLGEKEAPPMHLLLMADPSQQVVEDYLKRGLTYIMKDKSQVIGVYVLLPTRPKTIELVNIAVAEEFQSKGIGKKLLSDAIKKAKYKGFKTLEVGTGNSSINQLVFYQRCGFRITGIVKDFFIKHYDEKIIENGIQCIDMIRLTLEL